MPKSYAVRGHVSVSSSLSGDYGSYRETARTNEIRVRDADKYGELVSDPKMAAAVSFTFQTKEGRESYFSVFLSEADIIRLVRVAMARKEK